MSSGPVADVNADLIRFLQRASLEITPHDTGHVAELRFLLAPATVVYVAHPPSSCLADVVNAACQVQAAGFSACAHIVARRFTGESELDAALKRLRAAGSDRLLIVAGDPAKPVGPYASSLDVLHSGRVAGHGFRHVGVAGHPEGHGHIPDSALWEALAEKQSWSKQTGIPLHVVTQFGFDVPALMAWCRQLRARGISAPVHAGIAGPATLDKLVRYAIRCGIGGAFRAAVTQSGLIARLERSVRTVDQILLELVKSIAGEDADLITQPHFFPFGGCIATVQWIRALRRDTPT